VYDSTSSSELSLREKLGGRITALRVDFVAKPETSGSVRGGIEERILTSWGEEQGFLDGMVLVSDQEARLTTLITFWSASVLEKSREQKVKWLQNILKPYLDRCLHIHTDTTYFLASAKEKIANSAFATSFTDSVQKTEMLCAS